jgi:hypothetical protein
MRAVLGALFRVLRIGGVTREQLTRERARGLTLARAGGTVQQVRMRGRAAKRGAEHGTSVRMGV